MRGLLICCAVGLGFSASASTTAPAYYYHRHGHHHHHYHYQGHAASRGIPPGWQRQPADPKLQGDRFVSPDGTASFSAYITSVGQESIVEHMKNIAFADGEEITRLRGGRNWIEVSGLKGDRIFYRKSVLACGGTTWHEIAFDYPAEARGMNGFVDRAAKGAELNQDKGCAPAVSTSNGSSNVGEGVTQDPEAPDAATINRMKGIGQ